MLTRYQSRVDLYTKNINRAALQLILMQIAGRQTYHLRKGLQRWPIFELGIFLSQVMNTVMLGYEKWYLVTLFEPTADCSWHAQV